jgi:hypothetical protein
MAWDKCEERGCEDYNVTKFKGCQCDPFCVERGGKSSFYFFHYSNLNNG